MRHAERWLALTQVAPTHHQPSSPAAAAAAVVCMHASDLWRGVTPHVVCVPACDVQVRVDFDKPGQPRHVKQSGKWLSQNVFSKSKKK